MLPDIFYKYAWKSIVKQERIKFIWLYYVDRQKQTGKTGANETLIVHVYCLVIVTIT